MNSEDSIDSQTFDDLQDIARSSYADMLIDDERNHAYSVAIRANVRHLVRSPKNNPTGERFFRCCDIGTGSGLLSMLIVRSFRELSYKHFHVTAFECFKPMAECAKKVVEVNGMSEEITVVPTRSEDCKENPQFDLLVAELLDTELIGEGCLLTYRHAVMNLCSPNCIFIPKKAQIFVEPFQSQALYTRLNFDEKSYNPEKKSDSAHVSWNLELPKKALNCPGLAEIDDLQLGCLLNVHGDKCGKRVAKPQVVFEFDFSNINTLKLEDFKIIDFEHEEMADYLVFILWWDIEFYDRNLYYEYLDDKIVAEDADLSFNELSCAPDWIRHAGDSPYITRDKFIKQTYGRQVWREHWIQGVYNLPHGVRLPSCDPSCSSERSIYAFHDSHSLWFNTCRAGQNLPANCDCGIHRYLSRTEIYFINNELNKLIGAVISGSDLSLNCRMSFNNERRLLDGDDSVGKWSVEMLWDEGGNVQLSDRIVDYSLQDDICWLVLLNRFLDGASIEPFCEVQIMCSQVCFNNLNRIKTNIGPCMGLDLSPLDELINSASRRVDKAVEAYPLWQYESSILDHEKEVLSFGKLSLEEKLQVSTGRLIKDLEFRVPEDKGKKFSLEDLRRGWALVIWANLRLIDGQRICTGPTGCKWNLCYKQLVHFMHDHSILEQPMDILIDRSIKLRLEFSRDSFEVQR